MDPLPKWVKPGARYYDCTGRLYHVRTIVDDQVIVRTWWFRKRRWEYKVEPYFMFTMQVFRNHVLRKRPNVSTETSYGFNT